MLAALRQLINLILKDGFYAFLLRVGWRWALGLLVTVALLAMLLTLVLVALIAFFL
ncbi:MAG TPA: hypothetical protein VGA22_02210 [Gemmatimonadales bacterium]